MGTHISFVRSAVIDGWSEEQILHMMVGGNGKAKQYFKKKGYTETNPEQRTAMYSSPAAKSYKEQIQKDIAIQRATLVQQLREDSTTDTKPKKNDLLGGDAGLDELMAGLEVQKAAAPIKPLVVEKPVVAATPAPAAAAKTAAEPKTRTVIKSEKGATVASKKGGAMNLSSKKTPSLSTKKAKPAISAVGDDEDGDDDFDKMAQDAQRVAKEKAKNAEDAEFKRIAEDNKRAEENKKRQEKEADDRLKQYSNAKSLSSDQYFQRGAYAETSEEDKQRLGQFSNANAIGSDAFFGNNEDESASSRGRVGSDIDLQELKAQALAKTQQLGSYVGSLYGSLKSRYSET